MQTGHKAMTLVIGLTGGIGSGKTAVSRAFEVLGAPVVDTDVIAHELSAAGAAGQRAVAAALGPDAVAADGSLDRDWLRRQAFGDASFRHRLEAILHPLIAAEAQARVAAWTAPYGLLVVPLAEAVVGAIAGYLALWSVYWLFKLIRGKEGMGYGDFKLLAALGAWLGWKALPAIVLLSSVAGAVIGVTLMVVHRRDGGTPLPFGPYLAIAGAIALFVGAPLVQLYLPGQ